MTLAGDSKTLRPPRRGIAERNSAVLCGWRQSAGKEAPNSVLPTGPAPRRLRELLPEAQVFPPSTDPSAFALVDDAADLQPGEAYVELDGFDCQSASLAATRGAAAVITERLLPEIGCPQLIVSDSWVAKRRLESAGLGRREPVAKSSGLPRLIHTPGDDETATLAATILALAGQSTALRTSRVDDDGDRCQPIRGTRRPSHHNWISRAADNRMLMAVDATLPEVEKPSTPASVVCLTSRAAAAESRLQEGAVAVVCVDEADCIKQASTHKGLVLTFGEAEHADIRIQRIEEHAAGQCVVVSHRGDTVALDLDRPGARRRREAAAALAIAICLGLELAPSARSLSAAAPPVLQVERLAAGSQPIVLADATRSIDALCDALKTADQLTTGRVLVVADLARDTDAANRQLAVLERLADRSFVTGGADQLEFADPSVTPVSDREGAIAVALGLADDHDILVLASATPRTIQRETRWVEMLADRRASTKSTRRAA